MPRNAKSITEIRSEARKHTKTALNTLTQIAASPKAPAAARVTAASVLLDRGWGRAPQVIAGDGENPIEIIRRVIVDSVQSIVEPSRSPAKPCKPADPPTTH